MALTEEILKAFKQKKFKTCLELIKSIKDSDDVVENFLLENCKLVCNSLVVLGENNLDEIFQMQESHYFFFEKVASVGALSKSFPIQLKLTAFFNFIVWLTLYNDIEPDSPDTEEYLEIVNKGLIMVLGKQSSSVDICDGCEKMLNNLTCFKEYIFSEDHKTALLILELVVIIIIFIVNVKRTLVKNCLKLVNLFIKESNQKMISTTKDEFLQVKPMTIFKFGLCRSSVLLSEIDVEVLDCLQLLEAVLLFLLEDFKESLKTLQKNVNCSLKDLWNYLVVLNSFEVENWSLCFTFLKKMSSLVVQKNLKARFHIMHGKLMSVERNHKEALKEYEKAWNLSPNCPATYYYIGQEYGRMGLIDLMVENFEKLVEALDFQVLEEDFKPNFETILLDWIHPMDEITKTEAYYALAVSHMLNESFKNAADMFEKVLQSPEDEASGKTKRIIEMPNFLTVLHEAAVTNLMLGNLVRAEQIALDAIDRYIPQKSSINRDQQLTTLCKDVKWLQRVIEVELLETDFESKELPKEIFYTEDLIFFLSENVVGLLILSEIQRIQEIEDYKATLSKVFSIFSKYLAIMQKKDNIDEDEKHVLTLVKALAGKTCVKISAVLMKEGKFSCAEKMFKRALSCNKGDKDALYNYYQLLLKTEKGKEAQKLWNTFSKEKVTVEIDSVQSYSLRYFLNDKITKRELEHIQQDISSKDTKGL